MYKINEPVNGQLQNKFIQHIANNCIDATVFLKNGVKLSGRINYADYDAITLIRDGVTQLIFKDAIATVMPSEPFSVYDVMGASDE